MRVHLNIRDYNRSKTGEYDEEDINLFLSYYKTNDLSVAVSKLVEELRNRGFLMMETFFQRVVTKELPWHSLHICINYCVEKEMYEECQMLLRGLKYWEEFGDNDGEI